MVRQLAQDQSGLAYLASGAPLRRRWARLRRNVDEITTTWRHASVRAMADAVLADTRVAIGSLRPAHSPSAALQAKAALARSPSAAARALSVS